MFECILLCLHAQLYIETAFTLSIPPASHRNKIGTNACKTMTLCVLSHELTGGKQILKSAPVSSVHNNSHRHQARVSGTGFIHGESTMTKKLCTHSHSRGRPRNRSDGDEFRGWSFHLFRVTSSG